MSLAVWHIMAMSTSSNSPKRISSCFPPMNSIFPCSRRSSRLATSMNSSAGTAKGTISPFNSGNTSGADNPITAPSIIPI